MKTLYRCSSALALAVYSVLAAADPASTSAYYTDPQHSYVEDATSEGVGQVNMITCIMSAMRPDALVNKGNYNALVNESKCQPNGGGSESSSSSGGDATQAATYMTATVNAGRASNTAPMISKIWLTQEEEGHVTTIDVHVSATQAPSTANPYGAFRLDYCGKRADTTGACRMNGYLEGSDTGIRYFETETRDDGNGLETRSTALRLNASGTTSGTGRMQIDDGNGSFAFDFAYNASLYRRFDGNDDQCFSRDANDPDTGFSVWRYGLYDATSGARITRNSGFPIEYVNNGTTYHGYLGYYGLQLPTEAMNLMSSGATVQKAEYGGNAAPTKTDFTVVKSGGKLLKFERRERKLNQIDGIKFSTFVGSEGSGLFAGAQPNTQYEMAWDNPSGKFKVSGRMNCGNNGCQNEPLQQVQEVDPQFWQNRGGVQGFSQSLGGEVFIALQGVTFPVDASAVNVVYRTQDLVYPSQLPDQLFCLRDCPTGASLAAYFNSQGGQGGAPTPFTGNTFNNWNPTSAQNVVQYLSDDTAAVLKDGNGAAVTYTNAEGYQSHPQYFNGVRSGRLFTSLALAECSQGSGTYCEYKVNEAEVYYQWETGANSFNQFAAVKDGSGEYVAFDAPLQVTYAVPNGAAYGDYAGKSIVLQYGGYGDLWGIPGHCVSRATNEVVNCGDGTRYVPAFVIPQSTTTGVVTANGTSYLVKWLDREIRFAPKATSVCTTAGLTLPVGMVLPTSADLKNPSDANSDAYIGAKPAVDEAPRVIHGDVMF